MVEKHSLLQHQDIGILSPSTFIRLSYEARIKEIQSGSVKKSPEVIQGLERSLPRLINQENFSYRQIADIFGVTAASVYNHKNKLIRQGYTFRPAQIGRRKKGI